MGGWRIEKAKTSRGACRTCGRTIDEGSWRFGQDEKNATWFHLACAAEGAPRAFKPFAAQAAKLLAKAPAPKVAKPGGAPLPADVKAALERSDDARARAVLADWLTSQGDPWGELIALEAAGKSKEAKALFKKHAADLAGGFGAGALEWRDGLVRSASLQAKQAARMVEQLPALFGLRTAARLSRLELKVKPDRALFEAVSRQAPASLQELVLHWPGDGLEALDLPGLRSLQVFLRDPPGEGFARLFDAKLPALRRLVVFGKAGDAATFGERAVLSPAFIDAVLASPLVRQLESLWLWFGALDAASLARLVQGRGALKHVRSLQLGAGHHAEAQQVRTLFGKQLAAGERESDEWMDAAQTLTSYA